MPVIPTARPALTRLSTSIATAATLALGTVAAEPAAAPSYPGPTVSRYVPLTGAAADTTAARAAGCDEGRSGRSGVRILFVGTQEPGARLRPPGTTRATTAARVAETRAIDAAAAWAQGFTSCRTASATATLALGVNNKDDAGLGGADAGRSWARVVNSAAASAGTPAVTVVGAVDAEPSWSSPSWARAWVRAFTQAADRTLYTGNSADGCPTSGTSVRCNNGWTLADVHYVASGASPTMRAIPQIYRTDGIQARQWARISAWGASSGHGQVRFAGALSQHTACRQRGGCTRTDNTPHAAWTQLRDALNADPATRVSSLPNATDMRWP
ncbi:hypothetical protein HNR23_001662 [Nocardiopsis mwathae]|uniref:Uncharacterized protein n=1 Tax=Nocardiopsis mwathae TaxID=1472723 RepID=A0A7X0D4R9_9ACTN|nr:hypothetical protein [Nocardiopsis mwathae]MBB6171602.1 hypothetical protein [Nocardiopsis mwathae]